MKVFQNIVIKVPDILKSELEIEFFKTNFYRLKYISVVLLFLEIIIYLLRDSFFNTGIAILALILFIAIIIPIIWYCYRKINSLNKIVKYTVQYAFVLALLLFGVGLTFITQKYADLVHMYFMMIFGVTFFLYIKPHHNLFLLTFTYVVFYLFLPHFQDNSDIVFVIRINALSVNVFALIASGFLYQLRLKMFLDQKLIQEKNKELEELVLRDSMTKLYNHETIISLLEKEIKQCGKVRPLSIMIFDIDAFKEINDLYGHLAGDDVIKKVAGAIKAVMRPSDHVSRYGGDEFLIIMPDTTLDSACLYAQKIQDEIKIIDTDPRCIPTISGGISQYDGESLRELIALTDKKLYGAKEAGKNIFK